jgi:hypothetical protein
MNALIRELLQAMLGLCVGLALLVLLRDLIPRGRKFFTNEQPQLREESPATAHNLPALETELE